MSNTTTQTTTSTTAPGAAKRRFRTIGQVQREFEKAQRPKTTNPLIAAVEDLHALAEDHFQFPVATDDAFRDEASAAETAERLLPALDAHIAKVRCRIVDEERDEVEAAMERVHDELKKKAKSDGKLVVGAKRPGPPVGSDKNEKTGAKRIKAADGSVVLPLASAAAPPPPPSTVDPKKVLLAQLEGIRPCLKDLATYSDFKARAEARLASLEAKVGALSAENALLKKELEGRKEEAPKKSDDDKEVYEIWSRVPVLQKLVEDIAAGITSEKHRLSLALQKIGYVQKGDSVKYYLNSPAVRISKTANANWRPVDSDGGTYPIQRLSVSKEALRRAIANGKKLLELRALGSK